MNCEDSFPANHCLLFFHLFCNTSCNASLDKEDKSNYTDKKCPVFADKSNKYTGQEIVEKEWE